MNTQRDYWNLLQHFTVALSDTFPSCLPTQKLVDTYNEDSHNRTETIEAWKTVFEKHPDVTSVGFLEALDGVLGGINLPRKFTMATDAVQTSIKNHFNEISAAFQMYDTCTTMESSMDSNLMGKIMGAAEGMVQSGNPLDSLMSLHQTLTPDDLAAITSLAGKMDFTKVMSNPIIQQLFKGGMK